MKTYKRISGPYLLWQLVFILVPVFLIFYFAFTQNGAFSLANFREIGTAQMMTSFYKSIKMAAITTLICLLLAYPVAYIISQIKLDYQQTALMLVVIPMWMNFLLRTYSWITLLSRTGIINNVLGSLGIAPLDLLYSEGAVLLGMVYNFLPFMILPIYTILEKMDKSLIEAAKDLGANQATTFIRVILPLSMPGIMSGISMVFIPCISTFEITTLLGGNKMNLVGNIIEQQFTVTGNWNYGSALSMVLMVFLVISILFSKDEDKAEKK